MGDATALRSYADERIIVTFSVWSDVDRLRDFVDRTAHAGVMRRRRDWFAGVHEPVTALWWVVEGHCPSIEEAMTRLTKLRGSAGDSPDAFSFAYLFPPPDGVEGDSEAVP